MILFTIRTFRRPSSWLWTSANRLLPHSPPLMHIKISEQRHEPSALDLLMKTRDKLPVLKTINHALAKWPDSGLIGVELNPPTACIYRTQQEGLSESTSASPQEICPSRRHSSKFGEKRRNKSSAISQLHSVPCTSRQQLPRWGTGGAAAAAQMAR
ncbi:hypothetical protein M011DRAFT_114809 [Sporormia fimetaria CBS 119925]|uniref:Uncharacterized protein n=1 Tax=Sporormia fimetaria CBS 119925 TaxID=1340428 RepID=A0A6A6VPD1_9PLEO|nr:hypothetical protein M011DRAFT_114809 [Sporormia fimetaria CBS 119925]